MRALLPMLLVGCPAGRPEPVDPETCFTELATALSTDEMEGRGVGTEGLERAAVLIEERLAAAGLGDGGVGHRQPFEAVTGVALGDDNRLADTTTRTLGTDFSPLGFSSSGAFEGDVVWAGYGIVADELDYDDYAGLEVQGKVVLAMRFEPGEADPDSPFDGKKPSRWSDLRYKAMRARELGAAALVLVSPAREEGDPDRVPPLKRGGPTSAAGLPVVQVSRAVADAWLGTVGTDLASAQAAIDEAYRPASRPLKLRVSGAAQVLPTKATVRNVLGVLPGHGALADEVVVVGAHYDHLGFGGDGSMDPDSTDVHNGADDNASGTAATICAMERLAAAPPDGDRRTVVAALFAAEEIGLGGSAWYVDHPLQPLEQVIAMVNLDMVGRVRDDKLQAMGTDTAPEWPEVLEGPAAAAQLELDMGGDGYGPSDQTSFYEREIPVIHLFSGAHEEYHTPADDAPTLNTAGGGRVVRLVEGTLRNLASRAERLTYNKSDAGPRMQGDGRGFGSYLGTIPDFTAMGQEEGGVLLKDVRSGGPADRAGLKGGDVLIGLAGAEVQNLYDMTFVLRDHKPGETVDVVVMRDGERVELQATLGKRGESPGGGGGHGGGDPRNPSTHTDFDVGAVEVATLDWVPTAGQAVPELLQADETHLADLRQLTFGGENAEAYWSPDGRSLVFQRTPRRGETCDAQYVLDLSTGKVTLLSSGKGRVTCGYYDFPAGERFIYATTEAGGESCPEEPDRSQGYVWPLFDTYDLVWHTPGSDPEPFLAAPGYDAEATGCQVDGRLVFTSTRDGDLELYTVNADGSDLKRVTNTPGYDGGAFFSHDCTGLVWRASRPEGKALADYQRLLGEGLVRPSQLEVFWMELATGEIEQLTDNGAANFGPYPLPDDSGVVFSSNQGGSGREFDLWMVKRGGDHTASKVTTTEGFDGFPMFSPDGRWFVFASNRATAEGESDTNLFVARWRP